jgi:tripeptide aminopeptidase
MNTTHQAIVSAILPVQSHSGQCKGMIAACCKLVKERKLRLKKDQLGNLYITKGKAKTYPCVVAHLDTVHKILPTGAFLYPTVSPCGNYVTGFCWETMSQVGIGGDDKCGIIAAFAVLDALPACKIALFVDEEIGCVGSDKADMTFFKNVRFVLQADRRGNKDFVNDICGPLSSPEFQDAIEPLLKAHGYDFEHGMMSDVMALRDNCVGVSCANISAGYYNPHSPHEFISLPDLDNCIAMMTAICTQLGDPYPFEFDFANRYGGTGYGKHWTPSKAIAADKAGFAGNGQDWWSADDDTPNFQPASVKFPAIAWGDLDLAVSLEDLGYTVAEINGIWEVGGADALQQELDENL